MIEELLKEMEIKNNDLSTCPKCGQSNSKKMKMLGKEYILPIMCLCRQNEIIKNEKIEQQEMINEKILNLINLGLMDKKYLQNLFEKDNQKESEVSKICRKYTDNWEEMKWNNIGILLYGDVGTGKTFRACCIANDLLKQGVSICITSFPKILQKLTKFDADSKNLIENINKQHLLVIDDFGVERATEFALEQIFILLDDRIKKGLPLIITTNLNLEDFTKNTNIINKRINSRILEMCAITLKVDGVDIRQEKAEEKKKIARGILLNDK